MMSFDTFFSFSLPGTGIHNTHTMQAEALYMIWKRNCIYVLLDP